MLTLLVKAIRERLASRLWWQFVFLAIASFACFRFGMRMWGLSLLGAAQRQYREFLAHRRVHLYERIASLPGADKFLAIIKARNPKTGSIETDTVWLMADTAEQAYQRIHSGEWGKDFKLVSMSSKGVSVDLPALTKAGEGLLSWWQRAREHPEAALEKVAKTAAGLLGRTRSVSPNDNGFMDHDAPTVIIDASPKPQIVPRAKSSLLHNVVTSPPVVQRETWAQFRVRIRVTFNDDSFANSERVLNYPIGTRQDRIEEIAKSVEQGMETNGGGKRTIQRVELVNIETLEPEKVKAWMAKFGEVEQAKDEACEPLPEPTEQPEPSNPDSKES